MRLFRKQLLLLAIFFFLATPLCAATELDGFPEQVRKWAVQCRNEVTKQFDLLLDSGQLSTAQLFDTFYIPIPDTYPQKYKTQYDVYADGVIQPIIDKYQKVSKKIRAVYIVDRHGYAPTHNSNLSKPLTGYPHVDIKISRTKRLYNDKAGLAVARNLKPYLLQEYRPDSGANPMGDMSVPITIEGRHWGAVRIVFRK
ncbi:MAG: chemotaxis protein [Desulfuromonadales bacterium]|nr:chemotaxis protein [Desulfuromonadales bacterium]